MRFCFFPIRRKFRNGPGSFIHYEKIGGSSAPCPGVVSTALPNGIGCLGAPRCEKKEVQALPLGYLSNNLVHSPKVWCGVL